MAAAHLAGCIRNRTDPVGFARLVRFACAIMFVVVFGFMAAVGGLYLLLQGETNKGSALHSQLEASLETDRRTGFHR